jgi:epoxyqueuosine reductase
MSRSVPSGAAARPVVEVAELQAIGRVAGLDAVGVCTAAPFVETRAVIESRVAAGLHAGMGFTFRRPEYSTTPTMALRDARSIVVAALAYRRNEPPAPPTVPTGRVASYAWEEYYAPLKAALGAVGERLRRDGWRTRIVVDDNALVDRAAAVRAGLGWSGKSANVLLPGRGSWFVLGGLLTDAPLVGTDPAPVADGCGSCRRCLDGCPTQAIVAPGVVDARRCLSWLLQAPGIFPLEHRVALGDRIYGCDDCQEVCPPNRRDDRNERPDAGLAARARVDLLAMLRDPDEVLLERHGRWYIADRQPRWLRRNALVVLGNEPAARADQPAADATVVAEVRGLLARYLAGDDAMLVAHAVWAARRLGHEDLVAAVAEHPDPQVQAELRAAVTP